MDNIVKLHDMNQVDKLIGHTRDKGVVVYFYDHENVACRNINSIIAKVMANKFYLVIGLVDIQNFNVSRSKYIENRKGGMVYSFLSGNKIQEYDVSSDEMFSQIIEDFNMYVNKTLINQKQPNGYRPNIQQNTYNNMLQPNYPQINPNAQVMNTQKSTGLSIFQIHETLNLYAMLHKLGKLNLNGEPNISNPETIILPNGDRIIPLGNGKYGVIEDIGN